MDKTKEPTVIHCTTTTTIVNTKTGKTYKDEHYGTYKTRCSCRSFTKKFRSFTKDMESTKQR